VAQNGDILFTITSESINQMLQVPQNGSLSHFSGDSLIELYQKLTFPQRARIFEIFLPENVQLPKKNPPYPASMFPEKTKQIVS